MTRTQYISLEDTKGSALSLPGIRRKTKRLPEFPTPSLWWSSTETVKRLVSYLKKAGMSAPPSEEVKRTLYL